MTSKNAARRQSDGETNPKIDPAPNSNTEKEPDDWISGDDPMTGAQASHLKTLSEEVSEPDTFTQPHQGRSVEKDRRAQIEAKFGRRPVSRNEPRVRQGIRQRNGRIFLTGRSRSTPIS